MQILHGFAGSIQRVVPERCHFSGTTPSAPRKSFSSTIRVRRYLCRCGKRAVSLLPEFVLPYLRYGIVVIALQCLHERVSHPTTIVVLDEPEQPVGEILANLPEKIMRMWRDEIATLYGRPFLLGPREK